MNKGTGFLKAVDNRTGYEYLLFPWERDLVDETFDVVPADYADVSYLVRHHRYFPLDKEVL